MSKNTFQDIIKVKKKQVEINQRKISGFDKEREAPVPSDLLNIKKKKNISNNFLWVIALISVVSLFFAISFLFSNATVTVIPKTKDFMVDKTLTATKASGTEGLTYDLVVLSGEEQKEVVGGEEKDWEVPATGHVLIYNSFNTSPQIISAGTRLEGSNGKIYKTKIKVIIPGMLKNNTPGKIGVDIFGEKNGEEYNSGPLDFKILSFKGSSKYLKIYARSVGDIMGGLSGKSSQLSDSDKENAVQQLKDTLCKKLLEKAKNQIPKDFVLLNNATFLNIDEQNITASKNPSSFIVSIKGTFNGILFNKVKLTKEIISEVLTDSDNKDVYISNIENLALSSFDQNLITLSDMKDITFNLSGTIKIVWMTDGDKLIIDLLSRNKKDFNQILLQYPNIDSADLAIKPFWENSFPSKIKDIKVIINYPK